MPVFIAIAALVLWPGSLLYAAPTVAENRRKLRRLSWAPRARVVPAGPASATTVWL